MAITVQYDEGVLGVARQLALPRFRFRFCFVLHFFSSLIKKVIPDVDKQIPQVTSDTSCKSTNERLSSCFMF